MNGMPNYPVQHGLRHQALAWGVLGQAQPSRNPYIKHFLGQYNAIDV